MYISAPEKSAYVYKRMGKKRTRKEAHTEKSVHGIKRTRIDPH